MGRPVSRPGLVSGPLGPSDRDGSTAENWSVGGRGMCEVTHANGAHRNADNPGCIIEWPPFISFVFLRGPTGRSDRLWREGPEASKIFGRVGAVWRWWGGVRETCPGLMEERSMLPPARNRHALLLPFNLRLSSSPPAYITSTLRHGTFECPTPVAASGS